MIGGDRGKERERENDDRTLEEDRDKDIRKREMRKFSLFN